VWGLVGALVGSSEGGVSTQVGTLVSAMLEAAGRTRSAVQTALVELRVEGCEWRGRCEAR
jgi:hypothetical protein